MMKIERSETFGQQVCEALGIDANRAGSIEIRIAPQDILTVDVLMYATSEELALVAERLKNELTAVRLHNGDDSFVVRVERENEIDAEA